MKTHKPNKNPEETVVKTEVLKEMHERIVKSFFDVIVLVKLVGGGAPMGGYDIISFIQKKFGILISPGTIYSALYSLEREGLIKDQFHRKKRVYILTNKGENRIETILEAKPRILDWIAELFI